MLIEGERAELERLRLAVDTAPDGFVSIDESGLITGWNSAAAELLGWSPQDIIGRPLAETLIPAELRDSHHAGMARYLTTGEARVLGRTVDLPALHRDGHQVLVEATIWPSWREGERRFYAFLRDVREIRAAREALARSEQLTRAAFEISPVPTVILDADDHFVRVNQAFCALVGRDETELLGGLRWDLNQGDDVSERDVARAGVRIDASVTYVKRFVRPDGGIVLTDVTVTTMGGPGCDTHRLAQMEDITARRQVEDLAARQTRALLATIDAQRAVTAVAHDRRQVLAVVAEHAVTAFPAADGAVVELLAGDVLEYASAAGTLASHEGMILEVTGSLSGVALARNATVLCADTETDDRVNRETCRTIGVRSMCIAPLTTAGSLPGVLKIAGSRPQAFDEHDAHQLELLAASLSSGLRHAEDYVRNAALLEERTSALDALEASEQRFRLGFANSPLGMLMTSLKPDTFGTFLQVNEALSAILGYSVEQLTGMQVGDLHHPDEPINITATLTAYASGQLDNATSERRYRHADGHTVWARVRSAVARDEHGRALYLVSQVEDITEAREAQARLRQQARLLELIPAAVMVRDLDNTIHWWNGGAENMYGWPAAAALGKRTHQLLATTFPEGTGPEDQMRALQAEGRWDGELEHMTASGRRITVLSRQVVQEGADGTRSVLEINTDITAVRAAQVALHRSEQRFRAQFTHSAVGQIVNALDGTLLEVNPAFAAMLGTRADQTVGRSLDEVMHPDTAARARLYLAELFDSGRDSYQAEGRLRHTDGHWIDIEATMSLVRDPDGRPAYLIGVLADIAARKAAEAARDHAAAELADRNRELETANQLKLDLIGMLGHEINTPLATILGHSELLSEGWDQADDNRRRRHVAAIRSNSQQLHTIVHEVLAMVSLDAGRLTASPQPVDVRSHLIAAVAQAPGDDAPVIECPARLTAAVQPGHLDQILGNLLSNARKYGGGATRLTAERHGPEIEIQVADDGPGVPEPFQEQLFERFARADTTAGTVRGTGLGLYIVRELARANAGDVDYSPAPTGGSIFRIRLPATDESE